MQIELEWNPTIVLPWGVQADGDPSGALVAVVGRDRQTIAAVDAIARDLGYRVISSREPSSADALLCDVRPDLVVAEPVVAGLRLGSEATRPALVVVTDAPTAIPVADRCRIDAIACKPVLEADLAGAITRARSRRRARRRRAAASLG